MASSATNKGNRGQRMAISVMSKWVGKKFKSSSQSGMPGYNHDPHKGDILCNTEGFYFPFSVEVKFYKEINFCQLIQSNIKKPQILEFWKQCKYDAKCQKKIPLLMMRYNGLPSDFFFIVMDFSLFDFCISPFGSTEEKALIYSDGDTNIAIIPSIWLFNIPYKRLHGVFKNYNKNQKEKIKKLPIPGFDFSISNRGYIINNVTHRKIFGKSNNKGILVTTLCKDGDRKIITIYRWVAKVFVKNPMNKNYVNHIKPDRSLVDARVLEWVTPKENTKHYFNNVRYNYRILKIDSETEEVMGEYTTPILAAKSIGKNRGSTISKAILGKRKTAYGFKWKKLYL